jgi:hypothetical protein
MENNKDICESFIEEVDASMYYDYGIIVPLQMYLKRILERLQNNFYRRKEVFPLFFKFNCFRLLLVI